MVHSMYTYTVDITFYQNGSDYNVKVEWETGEVTHEPLAILTKDMQKKTTYWINRDGNDSDV
jgi:hypothetical protein